MKVTGRLVIHRRMTQRRVMGRDARRLSLEKAAPIVETEIRKRTPERDGKLRRGIARSIDVRATRLRIFNREPYASAVETGRKPGKAPPLGGELRAWARRRGIPAGALFPLARAIGRRGVRGVHMYRDGGKAATRRLGGRVPAVRKHMRGWRRRRDAA